MTAHVYPLATRREAEARLEQLQADLDALDTKAELQRLAERQAHEQAMRHHLAGEDAKVTPYPWCGGWGWLGTCRDCSRFTTVAVGGVR